MAPNNSNRAETFAALPQQDQEEGMAAPLSHARSSHKAVIPAIIAAFVRFDSLLGLNFDYVYANGPTLED